MTVPEEQLMKTEYIYVLGSDGKPQMPTRRKIIQTFWRIYPDKNYIEGGSRKITYA